MNRKRSRLPFMLLGLSVALIGFGIYNLTRMPPSPYPDIRSEFSLHSIAGPVSEKDLLGKVGLIYFGYMHCPDICPDTLVRVGRALDMLDETEREKIKALFITTDPERDSLEAMEKYTQHFSPHILGLGGSPSEIASAAKSFLSGYRKEAPDKKGNYAVSHASYIIITRPDGSLGKLLSHTASPSEIVDSLRQWLRWAD